MKVEIRRKYKNGRADSVEIHEGEKVAVKETETHWYVTFEDGDRTQWIPKGKAWTVTIL